MNSYELFKAALIALLVFAVTVCAACGERNDALDPETAAPSADAAPETTPQASPYLPQTTPLSPQHSALEAYRDIIANADKYEYGGDPELEVTGYRYALVQMQSGDTVPTLLLAQAVKLGIEYVRVFRFDPESGQVVEPSLPDNEAIQQGDASIGGFRGELSVFEDGSGICAYEFYSGTGDAVIKRISAEGDMLSVTQLWTGNVTETAPFAFRAIESWYDAGDVSCLGEKK